jgi:hypothetical protein
VADARKVTAHVLTVHKANVALTSRVVIVRLAIVHKANVALTSHVVIVPRVTVRRVIVRSTMAHVPKVVRKASAVLTSPVVIVRKASVLRVLALKAIAVDMPSRTLLVASLGKIALPVRLATVLQPSAAKIARAKARNGPRTAPSAPLRVAIVRMRGYPTVGRATVPVAAMPRVGLRLPKAASPTND